MKVLITGARGYIGSSLVNYLSQSFDVTAITRNELDLTKSKQVNDYFNENYFDAVIHCAVVGGSRLKQDSNSALDDNLKMYYNLIENTKHYGKFIHFGSGAEDSMRDTPYGLSKHVIRKSMADHRNFYDVRIYAVFDENELDTRFIKSNLTRYINGEAMQVHSNRRYTFFYMKDLVRLVTHILSSKDESLMKYNYASYVNDLHLTDICNFINQLGDHKVPVLVGSEISDDYISGFNAGYLLDYIGLEAGIVEVYNKLLCKK